MSIVREGRAIEAGGGGGTQSGNNEMGDSLISIFISLYLAFNFIEIKRDWNYK